MNLNIKSQTDVKAKTKELILSSMSIKLASVALSFMTQNKLKFHLTNRLFLGLHSKSRLTSAEKQVNHHKFLG